MSLTGGNAIKRGKCSMLLSSSLTGAVDRTIERQHAKKYTCRAFSSTPHSPPHKRHHGQDPHRVLLRRPTGGQQRGLSQFRGRECVWCGVTGKRNEHDARLCEPRITRPKETLGLLGRFVVSLDRVTHHPLIYPPPPPKQIDLRPHDSKNELKRKVSVKTLVPMERLRMRLGPFNEVHLFDKQR